MKKEEMIKRLIFHMYIPNNLENWRDMSVLKYHFKCLKEYSYVFNKSLFILSLDNENDNKAIEEIETKIIAAGYYNNVEFKIEKNNDLLREANTLYNEILYKLDKLDGITFFAHSKGIGNELYGYGEKNNLQNWIFGLYFFSLSDMIEVEGKLYGPFAITYGPFKTYRTENKYDNKYSWIYSGSFYWINCQKLYDKIKRENLEIRKLSNRFCSELFLGDLIDFNPSMEYPQAESMGTYYLINAEDYYNMTSYFLTLVTNEKILSKYNDFKNKILL